MGDKINLELLLRDLYESLSELSLVLDKEHEALSRNDVDFLMNASVEKQELGEKVSRLDNHRKSILDEKGLENSLSGMKVLIQESSGHDENALFKLWNMVSELTQDCTVKNKLIGIIIEAKRRQTNDALSVLQGYQPDSNGLYDAEGTAVQMNPNNSIAKA